MSGLELVELRAYVCPSALTLRWWNATDTTLDLFPEPESIGGALRRVRWDVIQSALGRGSSLLVEVNFEMVTHGGRRTRPKVLGKAIHLEFRLVLCAKAHGVQPDYVHRIAMYV